MFLSKHLFAVRAASAALSRCGFGRAYRASMSFRDGSNVCATRDSARLENPGWDDLVSSPLFRKNAPEEAVASSLVTHRVIYLNTHHQALVQATPPAALSMTCGGEGDLKLPCRVGGLTVVEPEPDDASDPLAGRVARALKRGPLVLVRATAAYAAAQDLESAAALMCGLEQDARAAAETNPKR